MRKIAFYFTLLLQTITLSLNAKAPDNGFNAFNVFKKEQFKVTPPTNLEELQNASEKQLNSWATLDKFDGKEYNYVTPQRPQVGPLCWAFATTGLSEVSILRQDIEKNQDNMTFDFDDLHLAWSTKNMMTSLDPLHLTLK